MANTTEVGTWPDCISLLNCHFSLLVTQGLTLTHFQLVTILINFHLSRKTTLVVETETTNVCVLFAASRSLHDFCRSTHIHMFQEHIYFKRTVVPKTSLQFFHVEFYSYIASICISSHPPAPLPPTPPPGSPGPLPLALTLVRTQSNSYHRRSRHSNVASLLTVLLLHA